jgi:hypothetical protein
MEQSPCWEADSAELLKKNILTSYGTLRLNTLFTGPTTGLFLEPDESSLNPPTSLRY